VDRRSSGAIASADAALPSVVPGASHRVRAEVFDAAPRDPEAPVFINPAVEDPESPTGLATRGVFPDWAMRVHLDSPRKRIMELPVAWSRGAARRLRLAEPPSGARRDAGGLPVFLRSNSLDDAILARLWDEVVATPAKEAVIASLKQLEPSVRDIDLRSDRDLPFRSRVAVRLSNGEENRAPIGSLGEGVTSSSTRTAIRLSDGRASKGSSPSSPLRSSCSLRIIRRMAPWRATGAAADWVSG
jgi:hypothetical protein